MDLGNKNTIILGHPWLTRTNPLINWTAGTVRMRGTPILRHDDPVAHAPPAMVLFFLFLFLPLTFAFVLMAVAVLCKPGCAISAVDTSLV